MIRRAAVSLASFALASSFSLVAAAAPPRATSAISGLPVSETPATPTPTPTTPTTAAPAAADKPADAPATEKAPTRDDGASFQLHVGGMLPLGDVIKGFGMQDGVSSAYGAELRVAIYATKHVGITLGGALDAYKGACNGASADRCGGFGYRVPIGVEYAFQDRLAGPFTSLALNALSGLTMTDPGGETTVRANAHEAEIALGWRIAVPATRGAFVPRIAAIVGEYDDAKINLEGAKGVDGSIPSEVRAVHYSFVVQAGYHFGS